jgi:hypothetical protein
MRISSTNVIEGGRVLYAIGKIKAASAWHAANGAPLQDNWRELVLNELIRSAEDIDADAIIGLDYETTVSLRSKRLGCTSSAFSPPASRSGFLARHSVRSSKSCDLSEGARRREHDGNRARQSRRSHGQDPRAGEPGRQQPRQRRRRCENPPRPICHTRFRKKSLAGYRANARARLRNIALKAPKPRKRSQPQPTVMSSSWQRAAPS